MENKKNVFETLSAINVSGKTEKKNGLTYLSWAYAWGEVKKLYPNATYKVYERDTQWGPVNYFTDGRTCWVKVGVTIDGLEHVEMLPIMDYRNKAIPLDKVDSCSTNKTIQRAITKACGRHGMGLYIYAGEDYPECESQVQPVQPVNKPIEKAQPQAQPQAPVKDTRPVTPQMVDFIRKTIEEHHIDKSFVFGKYKVKDIEGLKVYQANHICKNIDKLKTMFDNEKKEYLADIVKNAKPAKMETTFGDVICPPQQPQQEKNESEEVTLESLGLTEADLNILAEAGNIFS